MFIASLRAPPARQPVMRGAGPTPAVSAPPAATTEIAQRLDTLEALRAQGKITPQEYQQKRTEILSGL